MRFFFPFLALVLMISMLYVPMLKADEEYISVIETPWALQQSRAGRIIANNDCMISGVYESGLEVSLIAKDDRSGIIRFTDVQDRAMFSGFVSLMVGQKQYKLQAKVTPNRVDAILNNISSVSDLIASEQSFSLIIDDKVFEFESETFVEANDDFAACQDTGRLTTLKIVDTTRPELTPIEAEKPAEKMLETIKVAPIKTVEPHPETVDEPIVLMPSIKPAEDAIIDTIPEPPVHALENIEALKNAQTVKQDSYQWVAAKGEKAKKVIERWAKDAGMKTDISLDDTMVLTQDFSSNDALALAVQNLLKHESLDSNAFVEQPQDAAEREAKEIIQNFPVTPVRNYEVLRGGNLKPVLQRWSVQDNIRLIWDTDETFNIKQTAKFTGTYAEAIQSVLNQFKDDDKKPMAQLNLDPETKSWSLIVKSPK
jgi:hypothetical protein